MTKYKIGDKVKVRKDLVVGERYNGGTTFNSDMEKFKGKTLTISSNYKDVDGSEDRYNVKENCWCW